MSVQSSQQPLDPEDVATSTGTPESPGSRSWAERHNGLVIALSNLITALVVLAAAVIAGPWFQSDETPKVRPTGSIEQPRNPGVGERTEFMGEARHVPPGYAVWAFVRDVNGGHFYPKYSACGVQEDEWDCGSLRVGTEGSLDKESDLTAVLVSAEGVAQIMEYVINTEYRDVRSDGMKSLPTGSIVLDTLRVTRIQ